MPPPPDDQQETAAPTRARGAKSLGQTAAGGAAVTLGSQGLRMILRMAQVIILARLLDPRDLGLVAAVSPIIGFVGLFQSVGLQQAIIQRKDISNEEINRVFWVLTIFGAACTILVITSSPLIANFYNEPQVKGIAIAAAPILFLTSVATVPSALMVRDLRFRSLAAIDIYITLAILVASTGSAYIGLGFWALIIGDNLGALTRAALVWKNVLWRPGRININIGNSYIKFGANLTGSNVLNFLTRNVDNVIIAKTSGAEQLGYYDRGYKLLLFPVRNGVQPLNRVAIPMLSRFQHQPDRFRRTYIRMVSLLMLAIVPGVVAMVVAPLDFILIIFGEKWAPVAPIFALLGVVAAIQPQMITASWIFISQARTELQLRMTFFYSSAVLFGFFLGASWGALGVATSYAVTNIIMLPLRWWFVGRCSAVRISDNAIMVLPYIISSAPMWVMLNVPSSIISLPIGYRALLSIGASYFLSFTFSLLLRRTREPIVYAVKLAATWRNERRNENR